MTIEETGNGTSGVGSIEDIRERNEERRKVLRGKIRRFFAWTYGWALLVLTVYVFVVPLFSDTVSAHTKEIGVVIASVYGFLAFTFLGLAGVDGAVDAMSKRR